MLAMIISAPENIHNTLPAGRPAAPVSGQWAGGEGWQTLGRYGGALRALGIGGVIEATSPKATRPAEGNTGTAFDPGGLAQHFDRALKTARSENPGISQANVRHIAQYDTIMAHRSQFPPGELQLRTELGNGAATTTTIPAMQVKATAAPPPVSMPAASVMSGDGGPTATADSVAAAYAEWR